MQSSTATFSGVRLHPIALNCRDLERQHINPTWIKLMPQGQSFIVFRFDLTHPCSA